MIQLVDKCGLWQKLTVADLTLCPSWLVHANSSDDNSGPLLFCDPWSRLCGLLEIVSKACSTILRIAAKSHASWAILCGTRGDRQEGSSLAGSCTIFTATWSLCWMLSATCRQLPSHPSLLDSTSWYWWRQKRSHLLLCCLLEGLMD